MANRALIVVDLQQEYQSQGKLPLSGLEDAVANAAKYLAWATSQVLEGA